MKTLLLIALAILAGLYDHVDFRALAAHGVNQEISTATVVGQLKSNTSPGREKADTKQIAEETKDSAAAAELYDGIMPPLCLLMLVWLSLKLRASEKKS